MPAGRSSHVLALMSLLMVAPGLGAASAVPRVTLTDIQGYRIGFQPRSGDWIYFDLEPATLKPTQKGQIRLRNFTVVGDHEEIEWQTGPEAPVRSFERTAEEFRDGLTLSMFEVSFPAAELRDVPPQPIRFDQYHRSAAWPFRVRPSTLKKSKVVRVSNSVQYASHVVNIVAPYSEPGPVQPAGDRIFDAREVVIEFYRHFSDSYEEISLVPIRSHRQPIGTGWGVYMDVEGTNSPVGDVRRDWGDSQVLRSVVLHTRGDFIWAGHWLHETGHMWGFRFDLFEVAGIQPRGRRDCMSHWHMPHIAERHSFMRDNCLPPDKIEPPLCIRIEGDDGVLVPCATPLSYHPFQLYAMGLLPPDEVPPLYLRQRQSRPRSLVAGARVKGPFVEVSIDDVIAHYGERRGPPIPEVWRRAVVIVSPDRLLSKQDMRWFNFFAKRISDPDVTGIEGLDVSPSMEFATLGAVDLRTEIRPRSRPPINAGFAVSYPKVGKKDFPGLKLNGKLGTYYRSGRTYVVSGRVAQPRGHTTISIQIGSQEFTSEIGGDGRFSLAVELDQRESRTAQLTLRLGTSGPLLGQVAPVYVD